VNRRAFLLRTAQAGLAAGAVGSLAARLAQAALDDAPLHELAHSIEGTVVVPGSPAYARARLLESTRFDAVHPRAIVYCANAGDVAKAVRWARKHQIHVVARSGGHSYGGYSTTTGVVLDVSRLDAVTVAPDRRTSSIGAGAQLIDVYAKLFAHGVTIPGGSCATVGIAGLALGGGVGYSSRKLGLTCDNVRRVQIVTADGRLLVCDDTHHPDLFWALRGGGGGNFGIVTSFRFDVHAATSLSTYSIEWPWEQAAQAVQAWQAFAPTAPDELFSVCDLLATDPAAGARAHVVSSGQFFGSEADLVALIRPLTDTGTPTRVTTQRRTALDAALFWAGCRNESVAQCHTTPRGTLSRTSFKAKSDYAARQLPAEAIAALASAIDARQAGALLGRGSILMDPYGGAISRVPATATAFVHRDQLFSLQYVADLGPHPTGSRVAANTGWLDQLHAAMRPWVSGQSYQNYIDPGLAGWQAAYYGSNLARLRKVKRAYDPKNVFRFPQSIPL
jgi:FAD/FMN-containing dehydrogenase